MYNGTVHVHASFYTDHEMVLQSSSRTHHFITGEREREKRKETREREM